MFPLRSGRQRLLDPVLYGFLGRLAVAGRRPLHQSRRNAASLQDEDDLHLHPVGADLVIFNGDPMLHDL
jgi:hypothetical protein